MKSFANPALEKLQVYTFPFKATGIYVKREDLKSHPDAPLIVGNKYRKLQFFLEQSEDYWANKLIVSYGGVQSNSMNALSLLSYYKKIPFVYFTPRIPKDLLSIKVGNFHRSSVRGMSCYQLEKQNFEIVQKYNTLEGTLSSLLNQLDTPAISEELNILGKKEMIFVKQGGADHYAEFGLIKLAEELNQIASIIGEKITVILPAGTGTTAMYLGKYFSTNQINGINIAPIPCVGNNKYLKQQMNELEDVEKIVSLSFLNDSWIHTHPFASVNKDDFTIWKQLKQDFGIEFDLIYAPRCWRTLSTNFSELTTIFGSKILYLHTGGAEGNDSQLLRYISNKEYFSN